MKMSKFIWALAVLAAIPILLYAQSTINSTSAFIPMSNNVYMGGTDSTGVTRAIIGINASNDIVIDPDNIDTVIGNNLTVDGTSTMTGTFTANGNLTVGSDSSDTATVNAVTNMTGTTFNLVQGTLVASANDIDVANDGNIYGVSGTTQINTLNTTGFQNGSVVGLLFYSTLAVANNQSPSGNTARFLFGSAGSLTTRANELHFFVLSTGESVRAWRYVGSR